MPEATERLDSHLPAIESVPADDAAEAKLANDIKTLWIAHQTSKATARQTKEELEDQRLDLGWKLSEMKRILVRTGRGGGWARWLRVEGIARSSAERYVKRFENPPDPKANRTTGTITEPTADDVRRYMQVMWPKLSQVLKTREAVEAFIIELRQRFENSPKRESTVTAAHSPARVTADRTMTVRS